jgi:nucleoside phosphorylase
MDGIQRTLSHDKYTVGWICALPLELTAAKAMLEKRHERLPQPPTDRNTYALGEIFGHNVVLACLPEYGTVCAAAVATQMLSTFPAIRFGLMVGIGGGVPGITVDIRLGDIVVSYPTGDSGGVIQYDYGKTIAGGRFVRTGRLNQPPEALLTAVNELRSEHRLRPTRILEFVDQVRRAHPQLAKSLDVDRMGDDLFAVESDHVPGEDTCQNCDRRMIVRRKARKSDDPVIHYGLIASGNQVVKDARTRERYANELGILCFEMEAAGLMNHFPCLVIRGICDYSDSHKSKSWQEYAAVMAAAFAKELLSVASVPLVKETQKATRKISPAVFGTNDPSLYLALSQQPQWLLTRKKSSKSHIFDRLSTYEHDRIHRVHLWNVCPGTTEWILTDNKFETWLEGSSNPCLWLTGLIGSGKTLVTSAAIECMKNGTLEPRIFVAHFFYSHSNQSRLSARHAFESYAKQIIGYLDMIQKPCPEHVISCVKRFYGPKQDVPSFLEIMHGIILPLCEILPGLVLVVDGLDECEQGEVLLVCEGIRLVLKMNSTRVLISGRESLAVTDRIQGSAKINLSEREGRSDIIRKFIEWKIDNKMRERSITERTSVLQTIKDRLFEKAGNM